MFTGLVESTGTVLSLEPRGESARLTLRVGPMAADNPAIPMLRWFRPRCPSQPSVP